MEALIVVSVIPSPTKRKKVFVLLIILGEITPINVRTVQSANSELIVRT